MATVPSDEGTPKPRRGRKKWTRPDPAPASSEGRPWFVHSHPDFFDARKTPIERHHREMILILEAQCRSNAFCSPNSKDIAARYGCNRRNLQIVWKEMQDEGLLVRVYGRGSCLLGIVLRLRSDPNQPVGDTDEALERAVEAIRSGRLGKSLPLDDAGSGGRNGPAPGGAMDRRQGARQTCVRGRNGPASPPITKGVEEREQETTTTREESGEVVVPASLGGEIRDPVSPTGPDPGPVEAGPIDLSPEILQRLAREVRDEDERREYERVLPAWLAKLTVKAVFEIIAEARKCGEKGKILTTRPLYAAGIVAKAISNNGTFRPVYSTRSSAKDPELLRAERETEARADGEKKRSELEAQARRREEDAELEARWNSLEPRERDSIEARIRASNPIVARLGGKMLISFCQAEMAKGGLPS